LRIVCCAEIHIELKIEKREDMKGSLVSGGGCSFVTEPCKRDRTLLGRRVHQPPATSQLLKPDFGPDSTPIS
jgi:hypothetical protein